jgi:hypothetical protein
LALQEILNRDPETRVALSGPGSSGFETSTFGLLTRSAVKRFQEKYASEILYPIGLSGGTGFVGRQTLLKLKTISEPATPAAIFVPTPSKNSPLQAVTPTSDPLSEFRVSVGALPDLEKTDRWIQGIQDKLDKAAATASAGTAPTINTNDLNIGAPSVIIQSLSRYSGKAGANLAIVGSGFSPNGNDIYFGTNYVVRKIKDTGGGLAFSLPSLPPARYKVVVVNQNGVSNGAFFIVTAESAPIVSVTSASPSIVRLGGKVTISGNGFSNDNEIRTSYGIIEHIPSADGKTLSFVAEPKQLVGVTRPSDKAPISWQVAVYVSNQNGVSEQPVFFSLSL